VSVLLSALVLPALACPDFAANPSELLPLEPFASKGALSEEQRGCLETSYAKSTEQTVKNKISRVELVNAYAWDTSVWANLVKRHLDEVDRSDPDMAYLYAFWLFNTDRKNAPEVVRWTDVALERKQVWEGNTFVSRVYGLLKLRTVASYELWKVGEEKAVGAAVPPPELETLRTNAKTYAREWIEFAKVSGRDPKESMQLCVSLASKEACGGEAL
jgi:hypothetical protein